MKNGVVKPSKTFAIGDVLSVAFVGLVRLDFCRKRGWSGTRMAGKHFGDSIRLKDEDLLWAKRPGEKET